MQDGNIFSIVHGFKIPFFRTPLQHTLPQTTRSKSRRETINKFRDTGNDEERCSSTRATRTIKDLFQEKDFLIKIVLKDAYFGIPQTKYLRNIFVFSGRVIYANSSTYVLAWDQPL